MIEQLQIMKEMEECPLCAGQLFVENKNVTQEGVSLVFPIITCYSCKEGYLIPGQMQQMADTFKAFTSERSGV